MEDYEEETERQCCEFCNQELAHSAYYRHLHDQSGTICPGKCGGRVKEKASHASESDSDLSSEFSVASAACGHDSTFDFGSEDESESLLLGISSGDNEMCVDKADSQDDDASSVVSFNSRSSSSDEEEIWDVLNADSESDDET